MSFLFFGNCNCAVSFSLCNIFFSQKGEEIDQEELQVVRNVVKSTSIKVEDLEFATNEIHFTEKLVKLLGEGCIIFDEKVVPENFDIFKEECSRINAAAYFGSYEEEGLLQSFMKECGRSGIKYVIIGNLPKEISSKSHPKHFEPVRYLANRRGEYYIHDETEEHYKSTNKITLGGDFYYRSSSCFSESISREYNTCFYKKYIEIEDAIYQLVHLSPAYSLSKTGETTINGDYLKSIVTGCRLNESSDNVEELAQNFQFIEGEKLTGERKMVVYELINKRRKNRNKKVLLKSETKFQDEFRNVKETHYFSTLVDHERKTYPYSLMCSMLQECINEERKRKNEFKKGQKKKMMMMMQNIVISGQEGVEKEQEQEKQEEQGEEEEDEEKKKPNEIQVKYVEEPQTPAVIRKPKKGSGRKKRRSSGSNTVDNFDHIPNIDRILMNRQRTDSMELIREQRKKNKKKRKNNEK